MFGMYSGSFVPSFSVQSRESSNFMPALYRQNLAPNVYRNMLTYTAKAAEPARYLGDISNEVSKKGGIESQFSSYSQQAKVRHNPIPMDTTNSVFPSHRCKVQGRPEGIHQYQIDARHYREMQICQFNDHDNGLRPHKEISHKALFHHSPLRKWYLLAHLNMMGRPNRALFITTPLKGSMPIISINLKYRRTTMISIKPEGELMMLAGRILDQEGHPLIHGEVVATM
jgi:hypothetical protein